MDKYRCRNSETVLNVLKYVDFWVLNFLHSINI